MHSPGWQSVTNKPNFDGPKNTRTGLLMTRAKWCLAVNQKFVLEHVTKEEIHWEFAKSKEE